MGEEKTEEEKAAFEKEATRAAQEIWQTSLDLAPLILKLKSDPAYLAKFTRMQVVLVKLHQARRELLQTFELPDLGKR